MVATVTKTKIDKADEDAFWGWCADMVGMGAWMKSQRDLVLSATCSSRYGVQIDPDGAFSLGVPVDDVEAMLSVKWTSAALLRNHRNEGNFLALAAEDVAVADSEAGDKVPLRVYFPIAEDRMSAFETGARPDRMRLRAMRVSRGRPVLAIGDARAEVRLVFQNFPAKAKAVA